MIIGGPGAGKTRLAAILAEKLQLPVVSVDDFVWRAGGSLRAAADIDADVRAAAAQDRWIIEGGNSRTYADRLSRADTLVRLSPPRLIRMLRVLRRGAVSRDLLVWTWRYDPVFGPKDRAAVEQAKAAADICVHELATGREVAAFVRKLAGKGR